MKVVGTARERQRDLDVCESFCQRVCVPGRLQNGMRCTCSSICRRRPPRIALWINQPEVLNPERVHGPGTEAYIFSDLGLNQYHRWNHDRKRPPISRGPLHSMLVEERAGVGLCFINRCYSQLIDKHGGRFRTRRYLDERCNDSTLFGFVKQGQ